MLTTDKLGAIVPEATDRSTYVGNYAWSVPGAGARSARAAWLFYRHKHLDSETVIRFVSATGVRFVLSPCAAHADVKRALKPILAATRHFGGASVYTCTGSLTTVTGDGADPPHPSSFCKQPLK